LERCLTAFHLVGVNPDSVIAGQERKSIPDSIGAVYGRLSVGKTFLELSTFAGWCGHVSDP
jgi:hypothetical protein